MNRKQRIIISITGIVLVSLILIGLTYGYYLTKIKGNTNSKSISVVTANLLIEYADVNDELITDSAVEPGKSWTKTFVATNKGNKTLTYGVALENVVNQFERKDDIVYTLDCKQYSKTGFSIDKTNKTVTGTISGICNGVSEETTFPSIGTILVENDITDDKAQVYTLVVTYKNVNENQNVDMNKTFSAKANIVDPSQFNPYANVALKDVIVASANAATVSNDTMRTTMGTDVFPTTYYTTETEKILSNTLDDYGISYYYRGNVVDNYIKFAEKTWRIVRINGDGSIRLILNNSREESAYNSSDNDNAYIGYMYGLTGQTSADINQCIKLNNAGNTAEVDTTKTTESACVSAGYKWAATAYDATHVNVVSSTIKINLENWYKTNIEDTNNSKYVTDNIFCNDKTIRSGTGIGDDETYYSGSGYHVKYTSLECAKDSDNDYSRFTANSVETTKGIRVNNDLTYPIGLMDKKEAYCAGLGADEDITKTWNFYLNDINGGDFWSLTPEAYNHERDDGGGMYIGNAYLNSIVPAMHTFYYSVRMLNSETAMAPVINLNSNVVVTKGDGTKNNPYEIKLPNE